MSISKPDFIKNNKELNSPWDKNAELWINLVSQGYDLYRDHVNTPGFFSVLPLICGLKGLDIGCGEGHNTRLLASHGAQMTGIDITQKFVEHASKIEIENQLGIKYFHGNAISLPFEENSFDFTTAFVSLIDIEDYKTAICESFRVLKPGGFFQFSITHPCFWTPSLEWVKDENGNKKALACKNYFEGGKEFSEWVFDGFEQSNTIDSKLFRSTHYRRTLSDWFNSLIEVGYQIELVHEPQPSKENIKKYPAIQGSSIVAFFLIIRCRKK